MDIRQGLENLQWHSKAARHLLTDIIDKLDELDGMDLITSSTKEETDELINRKDNATVDLYNRLQGFLNLLDWYNEELKNLYGLEKELKLKLIQNDTDSDEVIRRSGKVYGSIFSETYYPETWDKDDFTAKTHSLTTDLKNRISNRLMRENEIPEFKERMVDYGANKDLISNEPMTRQRADRIASNLVFWIDHYLSNVCRCQKSIADILDEGYSLMYPDTSTEQKQKTSKLPPELDTPTAHIIWSKAKHNGWINEDYSFNGTKYQMAYAAECMADELKLKYKWKPFEILWNRKHLAQTRRESKERFGKVERDKEIEASFSL